MVEATQEVQLKSMLDQGGVLLGTPDMLYSACVGLPASAVAGLMPLAGP